MKNFRLLEKTSLLLIAWCLLASFSANAQVLISDNFSGSSGAETQGSNPYQSDNFGSAPGVISSGMGRGAGVTALNSTNRYSGSGWLATVEDNIAEGKYFSIDLAPGAGNVLDFTAGTGVFSFTLGVGTSDGPSNWSLRSSVDHFAADLATGLTPASSTLYTWEATPAFASIAEPVEFRLYFWGTGGAAAYVYNYSIAGSVEPIPEPMALLWLGGAGLMFLVSRAIRSARKA